MIIRVHYSRYSALWVEEVRVLTGTVECGVQQDPLQHCSILNILRP